MGRWIRGGCALAVGLTVAVPAVSFAQTPAGDSVTGTATFNQGTYRFDAHSGPSGEAPRGTVTRLADAGSPEIRGAVFCLTVDANRATIRVAVADGDPFPVSESLGFVEDHGTSGDRFIGASNLVPGCPIDPPAGTTPQPIVSGDIKVVDVDPPPTTYAPCRRAGWVRYGFASRADCIDYVHELARKKCIFERVAHGIPAFRSKYGLGPNHDHAMRHCVRLYTGF